MEKKINTRGKPQLNLAIFEGLGSKILKLCYFKNIEHKNDSKAPP